jgi:hypothetical protein
LALAQHAAAVAAGIKAIATQAGQPFPANIVAITSTLTALASAIGSAKSLIQLSHGGVISVDGDMNYSVLSRETVRKNPKRVQALLKNSKGKIVRGPSHAQGGIDVVDSKRNIPLANIEGNEALIPHSNDPNIQREINELTLASMLFNGNANAPTAAVPSMATGGIIAAPIAPILNPNFDTSNTNDSNAEMKQLLVTLVHTVNAVNATKTVLPVDDFEAKKHKKLTLRQRAGI